MAKPVVLAFEGEEFSFSPTKIDRKKLYGARRRVALDASGQICSKASLTPDGAVLIKSGMTSQGYFSDDGRWVNRSDMVGIDADGNTIDIKPSTLGVPQAVQGPVDPIEALRLEIESVFFLAADDPSNPLCTKLQAGDIYRCDFNYAAGLEVEVAYLIGNEAGIFALVGKAFDVPWAEPEEVFVASDGDEDEMDFDFEDL